MRNSLYLLCILIFGTLSSCSELRVKKYRQMLEPKVGVSKKFEINKLLGNPAFCKQEVRYERCEYRTMAAHNNQVPGIMRKEEGLGPDLSPYDYFDVLHLFYDGFEVLREWEPVVLVE